VGARFDTLLMRPPVLGGPADPALTGRLLAWCHAGALPLALASVAPHAALDAAACVLDGSERLQRLGRLAGLLWRVQVKVNDLIPGRAPRDDDPWDCGWLRPEALARLPAFRPRRATLLLLAEDDAARADLAGLQADAAKPLRLLVVSAQPWPGLLRLR